MKSDEQRLIEHILRDPSDAVRQLAYADWLEYQGDGRGTLIRLLCQVAKLGSESDAAILLSNQKLQLLDESEVVPMSARCLRGLNARIDDKIRLAAGQAGIPIAGESSEPVAPRLARLSCQAFDFVNSIKMPFVTLPAGKFLMGALEYADDRSGWRADDRQRWVTLTRPFHMSQFPVTQLDYGSVTGVNPSQFVGANRPVENVSWDDAVNFCELLTDLERDFPGGHAYRLPTEAEWEYACRAGEAHTFTLDDRKTLPRFAFYSGNSLQRTHEVGQKLPNDWGLYDMRGNVWEWCHDYYAPPHPHNEVDPQGPENGSRRINRGGSWCNSSDSCLAYARGSNLPTCRDSDLGFRIVRVPRSQQAQQDTQTMFA